MKETLLEFDDIIKELDLLFLDIPVDVSVALSDVILKKSKLDLNTLNQLESTLKTSLPETFKEVILKYDCGDLTIGGVTFGYQDNYLDHLLVIIFGMKLLGLYRFNIPPHQNYYSALISTSKSGCRSST